MQLEALIKKLAADVACQRECQSVNIRKIEELICSQEDASPAEVHGILSKSWGLQEVPV